MSTGTVIQSGLLGQNGNKAAKVPIGSRSPFEQHPALRAARNREQRVFINRTGQPVRYASKVSTLLSSRHASKAASADTVSAREDGKSHVILAIPSDTHVRAAFDIKHDPSLARTRLLTTTNVSYTLEKLISRRKARALATARAAETGPATKKLESQPNLMAFFAPHF